MTILIKLININRQKVVINKIEILFFIVLEKNTVRVKIASKTLNTIKLLGSK